MQQIDTYAHEILLAAEGRTRSSSLSRRSFLADAAAELPVPDDKAVALKARSDYKLLGKRFGGVDNDKIVSGQPLFGIDQVVPGMLYGVFHKCPRLGGRVSSANLEHVRTLPGVQQVFIVEGSGKATEVMPGVAIVATSTWAAFKARRELEVTWDESQASKDDWTAASKQAADLAQQAGAQTLRSSGDITQIGGDAKTVEAFYSYPFVAHAPLEPQNCTAWYRGDSIEIWAPTQTPEAGPNAIAFAVQSFLHEISTAAGVDHLAFMLQLMGEPRWLEPKTEFALNTGRAAAVIALAAEQAGWGKRLPKGRGMGLAFHFSHAGHFAEVAEVSVDAKKKVTVQRVVVAGDVGPIVNMSGAENQCQGAVIDGLSTMAGLEMRIENGRVLPANFDEYPILRIGHEPRVETYFIQSDFPPTGIGEPALPPLAPAVCNAIFAATGERIRSLPLVKHGFSI